MQVQHLQTLARVVFIVSVSGAISDWSVQPDVANSRDLRETRNATAGELSRPVRPAYGIVLTRDGVRLDVVARSNHVSPGLASCMSGLTAPSLTGTVLLQGSDARHYVSIASLALRGPPHSI